MSNSSVFQAMLVPSFWNVTLRSFENVTFTAGSVAKAPVPTAPAASVGAG